MVDKEAPTGQVLDKGPREAILAADYDGQTVEMQTDKSNVKVCACIHCGQPVGVNVFYAPAIATCSGCSDTTDNAGIGTSVIVQAGRTDPAKAARLEDALINKAFATAVCPLCSEEMELKTVVHNDRYGPYVLDGYDAKTGISNYKNTTGESVMLQCNKCKCSTSYSTTHQTVYRRMNEPRQAASPNPSSYEWLLGPRGEEAI